MYLGNCTARKYVISFNIIKIFRVKMFRVNKVPRLYATDIPPLGKSQDKQLDEIATFSNCPCIGFRHSQYIWFHTINQVQQRSINLGAPI